MASLISELAPVILRAAEHEIRADPTLGGQLIISSANSLVICYAPFEHVDRSAKVVILGITPGAQQAVNALISVRQSLIAGKSIEAALEVAKAFASFSGPMRSNLTAMLDYVGAPLFNA